MKGDRGQIMIENLNAIRERPETSKTRTKILVEIETEDRGVNLEEPDITRNIIGTKIFVIVKTRERGQEKTISVDKIKKVVVVKKRREETK